MSGLILLVEDNEDDQLLTLRAFKKASITNPVHVANDGVEALEFMQDPSQPLPALVLLDLKLPRLDGLGVLKELKTCPRTRPVPVVVLTSSVEERDLMQSYALGANSYLRKPVRFDQFLEVVRVLGLYWLGMNRVPR